MIRIVVDSSCDLTEKEANEKGIIMLPMSIEWDGETYKDGVELYGDLFYEKLENSDIIPKTSQVTPVAYEKVFREAKEAGDDLVCITASSKISGSYQSAVIASEVMPEARIIDSETASVGAEILVELAIALRDEGYSVLEIENILNMEKKKILVIAVLSTLKYLRHGGRISGAAAVAGELLNIKPVIGIKDGRVQLLSKVRGFRKAGNYLKKAIEESGGIDFTKPIALGYTGTDDSAIKKYLKDYKDLYRNYRSEIPIYQANAVIGTHTGSGVVIVGFFGNKVIEC